MIPVGAALSYLRGAKANYEECPLSISDLKFRRKRELIETVREVQKTLSKLPDIQKETRQKISLLLKDELNDLKSKYKELRNIQ